MTSFNQGEFIVERYFDNPVLYMREVLRLEPDIWQEQVLNDIANNDRVAVASGHGIGKTTLVASVIHWFMCTRVEPEIVVTSNTKDQLLYKTWRELAKVNKRAVNSDWFTWTATKFYMNGSPETWFAEARTWSAHKPDSMQGTHEKHVMVIFDEASAIDDPIWESTEGSQTTIGAKWIAFGNPTRNTGRFRECFGLFRAMWVTHQIDARTAKYATNKKLFQQWIDAYGEDSDFVRVRVKGEFPRASDMQFISTEDAERAQERHSEIATYVGYPRVLGCDIARYGNDQSVICYRQGRKVHWLKKYRELDLMTLAAVIAESVDEVQPDAIFVDGVGLGAGVVDRLMTLGHKVVDVQAGARANEPDKYYNLRAEMWTRMRDWLKTADIPEKDPDLVKDLIGPEYGFDGKMRLQLERKEDMRKRGLPSPDNADALALTFSYPVIPFNSNYVARDLEPEALPDY